MAIFIVNDHQTLTNVHSTQCCEGRRCVIHNPSDHHMRAWELVWRPDSRIMERLCEHGIGHPDPDDAWYRNWMHGGDKPLEDSHGCDGCCTPPQTCIDCNKEFTGDLHYLCPKCRAKYEA